MTDAKKTILARRARFVAAAVASVGLAACSTASSDGATDSGDAVAVPCLGVPADTGPTPCLEPPPPDSSLSDAGDAASDALDASDDTDDAGPTPCLKMAPDTSTD